MSTKSTELSNFLVDSFTQTPLTDLEFQSIYNSIPSQIAFNLTQKEMLRYSKAIAKYIYETYATHDESAIEQIMINDHYLHHAFAYALWILPHNRFEFHSKQDAHANRLTKLQRHKVKANLAIDFVSTLPRNFELASLVRPLTDIEVEAKYLNEIFGDQNSAAPESQSTFNINRATILCNELIASRTKEIEKILKDLLNIQTVRRPVNSPPKLPTYREKVSKFDELAQRIEDEDVLAELRQEISEKFNKQFSNTHDLIMATLLKHHEHFDKEDLAKWVSKSLNSNNELSIIRALELLALSPSIFSIEKLISTFDRAIKSSKKDKISNAALKQLPLLAGVVSEQKFKEWLDYAFTRRRSIAVSVLKDMPLDFTPELLANWLEKAFRSTRSFPATISALVKLAPKLKSEDLERFINLVRDNRSTRSLDELIRSLPDLVSFAKDDVIAALLVKRGEYENYARKLNALVNVYSHPETSKYLKSKLEAMYKEHTAGKAGIPKYSEIARYYFVNGLEPSDSLLNDWLQSNDGHQRAIAQIITTGTVEDQVELALSRYSDISAEEQLTRRLNATTFDNIFDTSEIPFNYPKIVDSIPREIKTEKGDKYKVTLPKNAVELSANAKAMKNCSGGHHYIQALSNGSSFILIINPQNLVPGIDAVEQTINAEYRYHNGVWVSRQVFGFNDGRPYSGRTAHVPDDLKKILQQDLETIISQFGVSTTPIPPGQGI